MKYRNICTVAFASHARNLNRLIHRLLICCYCALRNIYFSTMLVSDIKLHRSTAMYHCAWIQSFVDYLENHITLKADSYGKLWKAWMQCSICSSVIYFSRAFVNFFEFAENC
jgi:hypothetical protein